jgi:hypothetical protein
MRERLRAHWAAYGLASPATLADLLSVNDPATAHWDQDTFDAFLHEFHEILELDRPEADVNDLVDAIDHAVWHAGIDHVGIGSDFNHSSGVTGWMTVADNLNVTAELIRRSYTDQEIAKLWGGNFLRVWQHALDAADSRRARRGAFTTGSGRRRGSWPRVMLPRRTARRAPVAKASAPRRPLT